MLVPEILNDIVESVRKVMHVISSQILVNNFKT